MIGEVLKKTREDLGLDLREIAHSLKIQYENLKALENDSLGKLPAEVYTRGYIKEYARFLNIDPTPLINEYADYLAKQKAAVEPESPPHKKNLILRPIMLLVPLIVAVAAVGIYFQKPNTYVEDNKIERISIPSPPREEIKTPPPAPVSSQNILNITATETTWLRIEYEEGKSEEMIMNPGETKRWASGNGFNLRVGNAGGVKIMFNDKDMGVLGNKGEVVKLKFP